MNPGLLPVGLHASCPRQMQRASDGNSAPPGVDNYDARAMKLLPAATSRSGVRSTCCTVSGKGCQVPGCPQTEVLGTYVRNQL